MWPFKKLSLDSAFFEEAERRTDFTSDIAKLEQYEFQLLFIYDDMMTGFRRHGRFMDETTSAKLPEAAYTVKEFIMWKKKLGKASYPIALPTNGKEIAAGFQFKPPARIMGELYLVRTPLLFELDKSMANGLCYQRERTQLIIPYTVHVHEVTKHTHAIVRAWMYVGKQEYWDDQLDGGYNFGSVEQYGPRERLTGKYYYFTKSEFK